MERRKLLLGSGAALATVLAGCSGSDTDDDPDENEDENENEDEHEDEEDETENESEEEEEEEEEEEAEVREEIPGFDSEAFSIESDLITVDRIEYDERADDDEDEESDEALGVGSIHATADVEDREALYGELDSLAADMEAAATDVEEFKLSVDSVGLSFVDADDEDLDALSVDALWVYQYANDQLTDEQFLQQVLGTSEQNAN